MNYTLFGKKFEVELIQGKYDNGNIYLGIKVKGTGEFLCGMKTLDLTINVMDLDYGFALIDTDETPNAGTFIRGNKLGKFTGEFIKNGWYRYPLYELDMERINELAIKK